MKVKSGAALTLAGSGTLNVLGSAKNGIKGRRGEQGHCCREHREHHRGKHGLAADGAVVITGGTVNITAGNEGIKASPTRDDTASAGTITITGGIVSIDALDDGIHAANTFSVTGGRAHHRGGRRRHPQRIDVVIGTEGASVGPTSPSRAAARAIEGPVFLNAGSASVTASDDGINAAKDQSVSEIAIYINGGTGR